MLITDRILQRDYCYCTNNFVFFFIWFEIEMMTAAVSSVPQIDLSNAEVPTKKPEKKSKNSSLLAILYAGTNIQVSDGNNNFNISCAIP